MKKRSHKPKHVKRKQPGDAPGTIFHTGLRRIKEIAIILHSFNATEYKKTQVADIEKQGFCINESYNSWIQVCGLHDIEKLQSIWNHFKLHPLVQEDIVNTSQRSKIESYGDIIFIVLRMSAIKTIDDLEVDIKAEQISIVLGKNYVLSFQESDSPIFAPIIKRLELGNTNIRNQGVDYLAYTLIDCVVDHYFISLDVFGEAIESAEEQILNNPQSVHLQNIHALRSNLILFRKSVWSLRDGINTLVRDENMLIGTSVKVFLRDVSDHIAQVIDTIENYREMVFSIYDMYMSALSNKMNEIMKVLTIIATVFIPLTFIAGVYGMNFNTQKSSLNMPELNWYLGYPFSLLLMAGVAVAMLIFFKRKKWL
ncbi:MAG: magnesium/cobalt transporter CorA [Bacteroidales bacterium]|jgi:magnesium transporter|nr:magnesium/cobalt transporter CorA [Bacteroidales bacterium]